MGGANTQDKPQRSAVLDTLGTIIPGAKSITNLAQGDVLGALTPAGGDVARAVGSIGGAVNAISGGGSGEPLQAIAQSAGVSAQQQQQDQFKSYMDQLNSARDQALKQGQERGRALFGEGSLGRVEAGRAQEIADVLASRRAQQAGFTPEEMQAYREQNQVSAQQALGGQMRSLRAQQAASGVRGPVAGAQLAKLQAEGNRANVGAERDLFLKNIDARRQGADAYERSLTGARAEELARQQFNLGQQGRERFGQLSTEAAYGQQGTSAGQAALQALIGQKSADAQTAAAGARGGSKK